MYFLFTILLFNQICHAQNITIIESQSWNSWAAQDTIWEKVASGMGLNPTISPQSTLGSLSNLSSTDALIISSSAISLPSTYIQTLKDFVLNGGPVYVQSEYLLSYQGSKTFDTLMRAVGANFNWSYTVSGQLIPMVISGDLSTTPNNVSTLNYFNFGLAGSGSGVNPFLEYNGDYFGFYYDDTSNINGTIITISDVDWAWNDASPELMENVITKLLEKNVVTTGIKTLKNKAHIYPNPSSGNFSIDLGDHYNYIGIGIRDLNGKLIYSMNYNNLRFLNLKIEDSPGIYFIRIESENTTITKRVVVIDS